MKLVPWFLTLFGYAANEKYVKDGMKRERGEWLKANGYNIERETEIRLWVRSNPEDAVREVYGCQPGTEEFKNKVRWLNKCPCTAGHIVAEEIVKKEGFKYHGFDMPPEEVAIADKWLARKWKF